MIFCISEATPITRSRKCGHLYPCGRLQLQRSDLLPVSDPPFTSFRISLTTSPPTRWQEQDSWFKKGTWFGLVFHLRKVLPCRPRTSSVKCVWRLANGAVWGGGADCGGTGTFTSASRVRPARVACPCPIELPDRALTRIVSSFWREHETVYYGIAANDEGEVAEAARAKRDDTIENHHTEMNRTTFLSEK